MDNICYVDGVRCIVIDRCEYYTRVLTPMHEIKMVRNSEIEEV